MIKFFYNPQTFLYMKFGSLVLDIRWYAVCIMTGALIAYFVSKKDCKEVKYVDDDFFDSLFIYTMWFGLLAARLWYCAFYNFSFYITHPEHIIRIWDGGIAIQGGIVGGILFGYYYCRKHGYPLMRLMDAILPNVLIGQFTGRWGNFINQECHGGEVAESFFNGPLFFLKEGMHINGHYYEPLFFYESMLCIIGWFLIHQILKKHQNKRGDLAYAYMMWYSLIRFFIEGHRTDSLYFGNIRMAQLTAVVLGAVGLLGYLGVFDKVVKKNKPTLIFDMDGTLVSTEASIVGAYEAVFKKFDKIENFTDARRKEVIGPPLRKMFPLYFPDYDYDTLYETYRKAQIEIAKKTNHATEHSVEVLKELHERGYKIAVVSTRVNSGIKELSEDCGLIEYIDDMCGIDDVIKEKPDPEALIKVISRNKWNKDCIMIGDSMLDMGAANNYGAYAVAYLSNPAVEEEMKANSNVAIYDMKDLLEIVDRKINFTYNLK